MAKSRPQPPNIPTEEDFARASARMAEQMKLFARVREEVLRSFAGRAPLHEIYLFPSPNADYEADVFYHLESDIQTCQANGIEQLLKDAIAASFASGTNHDKTPTIVLKFDSHENVQKRCNGNYLQYLR